MDPVVAQRRLDVVWRLVLRSVLLVEGALLLATLTVPMLGRDTDPDDSDPAQPLRLLGGLAAYWGRPRASSATAMPTPSPCRAGSG